MSLEKSGIFQLNYISVQGWPGNTSGGKSQW